MGLLADVPAARLPQLLREIQEIAEGKKDGA